MIRRRMSTGNPSDDHEDTIKVLIELLSIEFGLPPESFDTTGSSFLFHLQPDINFHKPGEEKWTVIEVGMLDAERVNKYRETRHVSELRWYTRYGMAGGIYLAGQWNMNEAPTVKISRQNYSMLISRRLSRDQQEELRRSIKERELTLDSFVCCTGCGSHVRIGDLRVIHHHGRQYSVCRSCMVDRKFRLVA